MVEYESLIKLKIAKHLIMLTLTFLNDACIYFKNKKNKKN